MSARRVDKDVLERVCHIAETMEGFAVGKGASLGNNLALDLRSALDDIDDLTAQLAAKDADVEYLKKQQETWHAAALRQCERADKAEAALKAAAAGKITEPRAETRG